MILLRGKMHCAGDALTLRSPREEGEGGHGSTGRAGVGKEDTLGTRTPEASPLLSPAPRLRPGVTSVCFVIIREADECSIRPSTGGDGSCEKRLRA